jgi:hypothetical protein
LPAQPMIDAATRALDRSSGSLVMPAHDIVVLTAWGIGGLVASLMLFRWEPTPPSGKGV